MLKSKVATVVTDPYDPKMVGFKYPKVSADIVSISHEHGDHNQADLISGITKIVDGPGEYEIMGVSFMGFSTFHDDKNGNLRGKNTVYVIEIDGLRLAHLGDLGHTLNQDLLGSMGNIDILMIPVGGEFTIGPSQATEIVRAMEPNVVLPMHYQMQGLNKKTFGKLEKVDHFTRDVALPVEMMDKFVVKKENIGEIQRVIVLSKE